MKVKASLRNHALFQVCSGDMVSTAYSSTPVNSSRQRNLRGVFVTSESICYAPGSFNVRSAFPSEYQV